ncbi:hypothetical protein [Roseospira navarrensis]|uniref:Uncharacterized protein n=1 Tax=Roseospira navarrensis TaxID=140058 RepID=A0A7X1ZHC8_9PROT|nr:hypothetical protein [Roseospira navarrensis]MQX37651.1 hypothetical protein [Roseospira navarrensis]
MAETGFTRSPQLSRGAVVQLVDGVIGVEPSIVPFQYNPETVSRTLTPWNPFEVDQSGRGQIAPTAQPFDPQHTFTLDAYLDATDQLEDDDLVAKESGVSDRLAALESLLQPSAGLIGNLVAAVGELTGAPPPPKRPSVPIALLILGPGRILPVRVTSYSVEETLFMPSLHPMMAKVSLGFEVLTPDVFRCESGPAVELAKAAYNFFRVQQSALAVAHSARNAAKALSLLPF